MPSSQQIPSEKMSENLKKIKFDLTNGTTYQEEPEEIFQPPTIKEAHVSGLFKYQEMYNKSIKNPDEFWKSVAEKLFF